ncbi:MAG: hypothetical protein FWC09_10315 [Lachnospiraceae bacterium]|nr:hypothetical protein [Lachnospiraceae bacterium]
MADKNTDKKNKTPKDYKYKRRTYTVGKKRGRNTKTYHRVWEDSARGERKARAS